MAASSFTAGELLELVDDRALADHTAADAAIEASWAGLLWIKQLARTLEFDRQIKVNRYEG
jgi:hypothetical protein